MIARVLLLAALLVAGVHAAPPRLPERFTMGYLSERVEYSVKYMAPALALFRKQLAPFGVKEVTMEVAPSIEQMGEWVRSGRVDLFISTPYPVLRIGKISGVRPVLHGVPLQAKQSAFYVRKDSPIKSLADLDNKQIAFTFTYSSPGYFVPILHLMRAGFSIDRPVPGKKMLNTSLSGHNVNSLYWLFFGKCDVAAVGDDDMRKVSPKLQAAIRELERTATYPGFFVLISPTWTPDQQALMVDYLKRMHTDPEGRDLIHKTYACKEMSPIAPDVAKWIEEAEAAVDQLAR